MSFWTDLSSGAASGVFSGIGTLAKDIRTAITGKSALDSADQIKLIELAQALEQEALKADLALAQAQAQINLADAQSSSNFRGGWRPAAGWVCVGGLAYQIIARPFLCWLSLNFGWVEPPALETDALGTLLFGMLGLGGFRTFERIRGMRK